MKRKPIHTGKELPPLRLPRSNKYSLQNGSIKMDKKYQSRNDFGKQEPIRKWDNPRKPYTDRTHDRMLTQNKETHRQLPELRYQPVRRIPLKKWTNSTKRPQMTFEDGTAVNPKRHTSCGLTNDPTKYRFERPPKKQTDRSPTKSLPSDYINMRGLSTGQQVYLSCLARVYEVSYMIDKKLIRYLKTLPDEQPTDDSSDNDSQKEQTVIVNPREKAYFEQWRSTKTNHSRNKHGNFTGHLDRSHEANEIRDEGTRNKRRKNRPPSDGSSWSSSWWSGSSRSSSRSSESEKGNTSEKDIETKQETRDGTESNESQDRDQIQSTDKVQDSSHSLRERSYLKEDNDKGNNFEKTSPHEVREASSNEKDDDSTVSFEFRNTPRNEDLVAKE